MMATVPQTALADFALTDELQALPGVESCVVYEKAETHCLLPQSAQSDALQALGGLSAVAGADAVSLGENWLVDAPVVVMDDQSFLAYCEETGFPLAKRRGSSQPGMGQPAQQFSGPDLSAVCAA